MTSEILRVLCLTTAAAIASSAPTELPGLTNADHSAVLVMTHHGSRTLDLTLQAFGEALATVPPCAVVPSPPDPAVTKDLSDLPARAFAPDPTTNGLVSIRDHRSGPEWEYLELDLTSACRGQTTRYRRHLLLVQPDIFVVYDDLAAPVPTRFLSQYSFPPCVHKNPVSGNLNVTAPNAGLTAHWFSPDKDASLSNTKTAAPPAAAELTTWLAASSQPVTEWRSLFILVPHANAKRRGLGFKLLESSTAIGARIHRDGLPTLIAFRKNPQPGSANLTGLWFDAPVAVNVFHPKRR